MGNFLAGIVIGAGLALIATSWNAGRDYRDWSTLVDKQFATIESLQGQIKKLKHPADWWKNSPS